jgi:hypothetical protein
MFNHNRKWDTSSSSYYLELVYIYSIDHLYRIKKSCHCYNVLIRKATNIGSSLSWDSTLRYKCEQSSHLSFSLSLSLSFSVSLFPPKTRFDSICFTWIEEIDRQIACHLKIDHHWWWWTRVCIFTTHQRENKTVLL